MIAFIDTEVDPHTKKVADYGAVREDGAVLHSHSKADFDAFVSKCDTICGHNIINHDLKYSNYKDYSFVEQSRILKDTEKHIIDPQQADIKTKLVWFKLLDNYMTQTKQVSKLKTEPQKESFLDSVLRFLFP